MTTARQAPLPPELRASARTLAAGVGTILASLAAAVAAGLLRDPRRVLYIIPLWHYLTRTARRFTRLMDRLASFHPLPPPRAPRIQPAPPATPGVLRAPRARGWLLAALRHDAACYASQLESLLARPEARAILEAHPAAARLLAGVRRLLAPPPFRAIAPTANATPRRRRPSASPIPKSPPASPRWHSARPPAVPPHPAFSKA